MQKKIDIDGVGSVIVSRRKGSRNLRLSIQKNGKIKLSIPYGVSEESGIRFLYTKKDWIIKNSSPPKIFKDNDRIGKAHYLKYYFGEYPSVRCSTTDNQVKVYVPKQLSISSERVQKAVSRYIKTLLKKEAEVLILPRLVAVAEKYGYKFRNSSVKSLHSKWGSCSSENDIVLSIYLLQLPWETIDYVILHELNHTVHHNHSQAFWNQLAAVCPNYKQHIKILKTHRSFLII